MEEGTSASADMRDLMSSSNSEGIQDLVRVEPPTSHSPNVFDLELTSEFEQELPFDASMSDGVNQLGIDILSRTMIGDAPFEEQFLRALENSSEASREFFL